MLIDLDITDIAIAQRVLQLQRLAYQQEAELIAYPDLPALRESLQQLQQCGERFLGWQEGDILLGALAFDAHATEVHICRLVVSPTASRTGIAKRLLGQLYLRADGRPLRVSTATANAPAVVLYTSQGFVLERESRLADGLRLSHFRRNGMAKPALAACRT